MSGDLRQAEIINGTFAEFNENVNTVKDQAGREGRRKRWVHRGRDSKKEGEREKGRAKKRDMYNCR